MNIKTIGLALLANFAAIGAATAATVTIQYFGTSGVSGSFSLDDTQAPGNSFAASAFSITIGGETFDLAPIGINFTNSTEDGFIVLGGEFDFTDPITSLEVNLFSTDASVFGSNSVQEIIDLAASGDLSSFQQRFIRATSFIDGGPLGDCANMPCEQFFQLTSLSLQPSEVPIPGAIPLFLAGLAGLGAVRRRKKAQS